MNTNDIEEIAQVFVRKDDYNEDMKKIAEERSKDRQIVIAMGTKLNWLIAMVGAIATGMIPIVLKALFG